MGKEVILKYIQYIPFLTTRPAFQTILPECNLQGFYYNLPNLEGGKYPTPTHSGLPDPHKGVKKLRITCKVHNPGSLKDQYLIIDAQNASFLPTPYHHITKGQFTPIPFTQNIIYGLQENYKGY